MTSLRASRPATVALALALGIVGAVTGLAGAAFSTGSAPPGPAAALADVAPVAGLATVTATATTAVPATITATASPVFTGTATVTASPSVTATASPTPTLTPVPTATPTLRPPGPTCRVAATGLSADPAVANLHWSRVQNTGATTVTVQALQVGWGGAYALGQVLLRTGGEDATVFAGMATSPALVALAPPSGRAGVVRLSPGQSVEVGVRFAPLAGVPADTLAPGPAVLFTAEGCLVALAAAPAVSDCGLVASGPRLDESEPRAVVVTVTNQGTTTQDVVTLELRWPVADNGALMTVRAGAGPEAPVPPGVGDTNPAVVDLARVFGGPVRLPPGAKVDLVLRFDHPVAPPPAPYTVVLATRQGCLVTATTWVGATECGVAAQGLDTVGVTARLRLFNRRAVTRTLSALTLYWPAATNGPLVGVAVDGRPVWTGVLPRSPATVALPDGGYLGPGRTSEIQLTFRPTVGEPTAPRVVASGDYTVVAWLQGGCQVTYSTASGQPLRCSVSASDWLILDESHAGVRLTNAGAEATLRRLALSWPRKNGNLVGVWLGGVSLFTGVAVPGVEPFPLSFLPGRGPVLPRNDTRELLLAFDGRAVQGGYSASVQFDDPSGSACSDILVTARPAEVACRLSMSDLRVQEAIHAEVTVENAGPDELELDSLTVDWPNPWRLVNLVQVALVSGGRADVIWSGQQLNTPATIRPNAGSLPLLPANTRTTLRLRFGHVLDMPEPERSFKVALTTVEGCQAGYAAEGEPAPPQEASFAGLIRELPAITGLYGTWRVDTDQGLRLVEVDRNTRFSPASMMPRPGYAVFVRALVADERLFAQEITFTHPEVLQTFEGIIEDLDAADPPAWLLVAGERIAVVPGTTEIVGLLELGAAVTVKARRLADGQVEALSITVRQPPAGEPVSFTGVVQGARAEAPGQLWEVDRFTVRVLAGTRVRGLDTPGGLPAAGQRAQVRGRLDADSIVTASEVVILPDPVVSYMTGRIVAVPAAGVLGEWTVDVAGRLVRFTVDAPSVVDTRVGPAVPGMLARLRLQDLGDGRFVALRVRVDWPD